MEKPTEKYKWLAIHNIDSAPQNVRFLVRWQQMQKLTWLHPVAVLRHKKYLNVNETFFCTQFLFALIIFRPLPTVVWYVFYAKLRFCVGNSSTNNDFHFDWDATRKKKIFSVLYSRFFFAFGKHNLKTIKQTYLKYLRSWSLWH